MNTKSNTPISTRVFQTLTILAIFALAFGSVGNVAAQAPDFPEGFCENKDGRAFNAESPLPAQDPCGGETTFEVVSAEAEAGVFTDDVMVLETYEEVFELLSGIVWAVPAEVVESEVVAELSDDCYALSTRDERLICLDVIYDVDAQAWIDTIGDNMSVTFDARQPDEYHPTGNPDTVRGHQVNGSGTLTDPRACVTTDNSDSVTDYSVKYQIPGGNAALYGGVVSFDGPVSVWADCTDWTEFAALLDGSEPASVEELAPAPGGEEFEVSTPKEARESCEAGGLILTAYHGPDDFSCGTNAADAVKEEVEFTDGQMKILSACDTLGQTLDSDSELETIFVGELQYSCETGYLVKDEPSAFAVWVKAYWLWIVGGLAVLIAIWLIIRFLRNRNSSKKTVQKPADKK